MEVIIKPTYKCDFCSKLYQRKNFAEAHEIKCKKNPDNFRVCHGCDFLEQVEREYYYDTYCGEGSRMVKVFYCSKVETYLYPASVGHNIEAPYEFGDIENEPMKNNCDMFEFNPGF